MLYSSNVGDQFRIGAEHLQSIDKDFRFHQLPCPAWTAATSVCFFVKVGCPKKSCIPQTAIYMENDLQNYLYKPSNAPDLIYDERCPFETTLYDYPPSGRNK